MGASPGDDPNAAMSRLRWTVSRIKRHAGWARTQGIRRLVEEDQLDPLQRVPIAAGKALWRLRHDASPNATPVFLVGLQRSGTNMLVRGLERSPRFEVHNENDRRAFDRFFLRPSPAIRSIVTRSHHDFVLFKPLCDSHRITHLLDDLGTPTRGKAIWAYRGVDGRARSAVAKFGDTNLRILARIARGEGDRLWQAQSLSDASRDLIGSLDYERMTPESAAALFWFVRNSLYFELGLDRRDDVHLVSYDAMLATPAPTMRSLCSFLGFPFEDRLIGHIRAHAPKAVPLAIDPAVRAACDGLQARLDEAAARGAAPHGG